MIVKFEIFYYLKDLGNIQQILFQYDNKNVSILIKKCAFITFLPVKVT